jgi:DNA-binding NtrC family response regulator
MTDKRRILIVDDEAAQRELLEGFVAPLGFEVSCVGNAEDALQHIRDEPVDMVLLDVRLPGMSGLDALPEIRGLSPELPVLLITAYGDLRQAIAAVKGGAVDYLVKPVDLNELEVVIVDTLGISTTGKATDAAARCSRRHRL